MGESPHAFAVVSGVSDQHFVDGNEVVVAGCVGEIPSALHKLVRLEPASSRPDKNRDRRSGGRPQKGEPLSVLIGQQPVDRRQGSLRTTTRVPRPRQEPQHPKSDCWVTRAPLECSRHAVVEQLEVLDHGVGVHDRLVTLEPAQPERHLCVAERCELTGGAGPLDRVRRATSRAVGSAARRQAAPR